MLLLMLLVLIVQCLWMIWDCLFNPAYYHRKIIFHCSEKKERVERELWKRSILKKKQLPMVLRKAITTKITFSGFLVIKSSCTWEYILIFLQEHCKKVTKIGSRPIKGRGLHFNFLIKVQIVTNRLLKIWKLR